MKKTITICDRCKQEVLYTDIFTSNGEDSLSEFELCDSCITGLKKFLNEHGE